MFDCLTSWVPGSPALARLLLLLFATITALLLSLLSLKSSTGVIELCRCRSVVVVEGAVGTEGYNEDRDGRDDRKDARGATGAEGAGAVAGGFAICADA